MLGGLDVGRVPESIVALVAQEDMQDMQACWVCHMSSVFLEAQGLWKGE